LKSPVSSIAALWSHLTLSQVQCIGEAFGVDPDNKEQTEKLSIAPAKLLNVFDVFLKTRQRTQGSSSSAAPDSGATASTSSSSGKEPSAADKAAADALKQKGNALMSSKKYDEAIAEYTKAIDLDATNPVFFSNRAAAHASKGDHLSAIGDAEQAISIDPKFVKAYSRLGYVYQSPSLRKHCSQESLNPLATHSTASVTLMQLLMPSNEDWTLSQAMQISRVDSITPKTA
jgi:tetratricopeptide (TPR) repeat protein